MARDARMVGWPLLFACTIFLSAFLLFQVQPIAGKIVLPWFGGGSNVWITTVMFFQVALLGGYAYAHFVALRLGSRAQGVLHSVLLLAAILALPQLINPNGGFRPSGDDSPTWRLLLLLTLTVGPPYLLLSTTGPLLQHWFALRYPTRSPYPLYALSNVGSLLALLSYPAVFESTLGLRAQAWLWSTGYVLFAAACVGIAWEVARNRGAAGEAAPTPASPASRAAASVAETPVERLDPMRLVFWTLLPAVSSMLLLAITTRLTQDVAAVPLLWVLPLAVYLLTFIACFSSDNIYEPTLYTLALIPACFAGVYVLQDFSAVLQLALYMLVLFLACMSLHGETARMRPGPGQLTAFYLMISVGGALGGVFVGLAAPVIFDGYWEYHLAVFATPLLVLLSRVREERVRGPSRSFLLGGIAVGAGLLFSLGLYLQRNIQLSYVDTLALERNFYGVVRIYDPRQQPPRWDMQHGRILHGFQFQQEAQRAAHTGYYGEGSGIGVALTQHPARGQRPLTVGVTGLGTGTIASYAERGDRWTFYEINPLVTKLADSDDGFFTYLRDARTRGASVEVVHGDARTVLEQQLQRDGAAKFDVLVMDAFNSDAVPVHLLTQEAMQLYVHHLAPDGLLLVHISNAFVDLAPVVRGFAADSGTGAYWVHAPGVLLGDLLTDWVIVTRNEAFLARPEVQKRVTAWPAGARAPVRWTDDYTSVYSLLTLD